MVGIERMVKITFALVPLFGDSIFDVIHNDE